MKRKARQVAQFVIFFGLGAGLLWWQYSRFTPDQRDAFYSGLANADYFWFGVAVIIGMFAHLMRAIRWNSLLVPIGQRAKLGNRFYAVMIGYLANYAFPRLGEVTRCGVIKTSDDVPFSEAFGTVVVERIVDFFCLGLIFLIVLLMQFAQLQSLWLEFIWTPASEKLAGFTSSPVKIAIVAGSLILVVAAFMFLRKKVGGKVREFLVGIKEGILSVRKVKRPVVFILQSLSIWAGYYLALYVCFFCFPETSSLTLNSALILILFGTFGVAFTPGGIGAYQFIITEIMIAIAPHTEGAAASFSWLSWGSQVFTVVLFTGVAFAIRRPLNKLQS